MEPKPGPSSGNSCSETGRNTRRKSERIANLENQGKGKRSTTVENDSVKEFKTGDYTYTQYLTADLQVMADVPTYKIPQKVVGVQNNEDGELQYLVEWLDSTNNSKVPGFVKSNVFQELYPELILDFYETHVEFSTAVTSDELEKLASNAIALAKKFETSYKYNGGSSEEKTETSSLYVSFSPNCDEKMVTREN